MLLWCNGDHEWLLLSFHFSVVVAVVAIAVVVAAVAVVAVAVVSVIVIAVAVVVVIFLVVWESMSPSHWQLPSSHDPSLHYFVLFNKGNDDC